MAREGVLIAVMLIFIQGVVEAGPDIVFKYIDDYDLIARDTGSGAEVDAAVLAYTEQ